MVYSRIVLSFITILRFKVGLFLTQKIIPNLSHGREGLHLKGGELAGRWITPPLALALSELLHQDLIVYVRK